MCIGCGVGIIQSLADSDQKTGEELEERINTFARNNGINCQAVLFDLHSKQYWEFAWNGIYTSIDQLNIIPIIHLVMHGNSSHIGNEYNRDIFKQAQSRYHAGLIDSLFNDEWEVKRTL